jgi:hypothetical protein
MILKIKKIIKIFVFLIVLSAIGLSVSINYFANSLIYFDRVNKQIEKFGNPSELGLTFNNEKIMLPNKGFCYGWYIPASRKTKKMVFLVHGRESNKTKLLKYVSFLNKAQYNVFLMDFRNSGDSYYAPCSMGYYESKELVSAVRYLKEKYKIKEIAIIGFSMGGATTVLAARDIQNREDIGVKVKAIVLDSTYSSLKDIVEYRAKNKNFSNKYYLKLILKYISWRLKFNFDEVDLIKVLNSDKMLSLPVFVIHGYKDFSVLQSNSKKIFDSLAGENRNKEAWFPENVEHVKAFDEYPKDYKNKILKFFKSANF